MLLQGCGLCMCLQACGLLQPVVPCARAMSSPTHDPGTYMTCKADYMSFRNLHDRAGSLRRLLGQQADMIDAASALQPAPDSPAPAGRVALISPSTPSVVLQTPFEGEVLGWSSLLVPDNWEVFCRPPSFSGFSPEDLSQSPAAVHKAGRNVLCTHAPCAKGGRHARLTGLDRA